MQRWRNTITTPRKSVPHVAAPPPSESDNIIPEAAEQSLVTAAAPPAQKLGTKKVVKKTVRVVKKIVKKKVPKSLPLLDSLANPICTTGNEVTIAIKDCEAEEEKGSANIASLATPDVLLDSENGVHLPDMVLHLDSLANPIQLETENLEPCSAVSNLECQDTNASRETPHVVLDSEKGPRRSVKIVKKIVKKKVPARNSRMNGKGSENGDTENSEPCGAVSVGDLRNVNKVEKDTIVAEGNLATKDCKVEQPPNLDGEDANSNIASLATPDVVLDSEKGACHSVKKIVKIVKKRVPKLVARNDRKNENGNKNGGEETTLNTVGVETENLEPCKNVLAEVEDSKEHSLHLMEVEKATSVSEFGATASETPILNCKGSTVVMNDSMDMDFLETQNVVLDSEKDNLGASTSDNGDSSKDTNSNIADVVLDLEKGTRRSVKTVKKIVKKKVPKLAARNSRKREQGSGNGDTETNLKYNLEPCNVASAEGEDSKKHNVQVREVEKATGGSDFGGTANALEPLILKFSDTAVVENNNMDSFEAQTLVLDLEKDNLDASTSDSAYSGKDHNLGLVGEETKEALDTSLGLNEGIIMSGEMEALERKRRRRTEIFIGGLDKETKEGDIRRIFEEVGEVVDVTLVINRETGKNKGFAFLRYASAADAKKAVERYSKVEICGKKCGVSLVEGNDTIYLGNIDKKWKTEDVIDLLKKAGIENIDKVTVMADPNNIEHNRGFAFVELETSKEAQIAFNKLQKKAVFGKHMKVKVAWAQPLIEPNEEEMLKVKSVYAEYLPSSWNEEKVQDYFSKFGEIESIALAKDLPSSKRKDFAFVNYIGRESALACIDAFSHEPVNNSGSKVNMKVSLAKPMVKSKQTKRANVPSKKDPREEKKTQNQSTLKRQEPNKKVNYTRRYNVSHRVDAGSSTTNELLHLLRQQASGGQLYRGPRIGSDVDHQYSSSGSKRPFSAVVDNPHRMDSGGVSQMRLESSYQTARQSMWSHNHGPLGTPSFAYNRQLGRGHSTGSAHVVESFPSYFQSQERGPYGGHYSIYHRH